MGLGRIGTTGVGSRIGTIAGAAVRLMGEDEPGNGVAGRKEEPGDAWPRG